LGGLQRPIGLANAGDDRLFVIEQQGIIQVVRNGAVLAQPLLDIRDRVNSSGNEQGLLGLAFHPDFARNGYFYVNYTRAGGDTVVSQFSASVGDTPADPGSEQVLLTIDQPYSNHNGGTLIFGPDGDLYISTGDGGSANDPFRNGQSVNTLLGKLLRIDVNAGDLYGISPDNPFATGGGQPEIWAYGLRNPWRISFDRLTGDLYIGDVGQGDWEEIDFVPAGSPGGINFGWNLREGFHPFAGFDTEGLTDPVAEYPHRGGACSVTGGEVVRDPSLPAWSGVYLYGDYCSGEVWGLVRDSGGVWQSDVLFNTELSISSFGLDVSGGVYLVDRGGGVYRLEANQ
jgi:glucose/arabinose dehydrogenase